MKKFFLLLLFYHSLQAATIPVTSNSGDVATAGSLPFVILNANAGDTIDCTQMGPTKTVTLVQSLPAVTSLTIIGGTAGTVTIIGSDNFQIFSAVSGNVGLQNFALQHGRSQGGVGGVGFGGGGGGAAGGGGLYVHNGATVFISGVTFANCSAVGGAGGANGAVCGGGGGSGFNDDGTATNGAGGAGNATQAGGGAGGNTGGGAGGTGGGAGSTGTLLGGGGGGSSGGGGGGTAANPTGGGGASGTNGGGGAGIGGNGGAASATVGGVGGNGKGTDQGFAGGGGGGGLTGGAGKGTGGGGGGTSTTPGGAGGTDGGGGGGSAAGGTGGEGGFGAGGGGGTTGGISLFGGGTGVTGGGGGAAMGGTIFVQNGGKLMIGDGFTSIGSTVMAGAGGAPDGNPGSIFNTDIFLRSGGTIVFFNTTGDLTIPTAILSDQNMGGGGTTGGLQMDGARTVILPIGSNYTGTTTFHAGIIQVSDDSALGNTASPVAGLVFTGGTLQIAGATGFTLNTGRTVALTGNGTIDVNTAGSIFTIDNSSNVITGVGGLIKSGPGKLQLIGSGTNTYTGGTTINGGVLETNADTFLGAVSTTAVGITLNNGTLLMDFGYTASSRLIQVSSGGGTIQLSTQTATLSGVISGSGALNLTGTGTLILTGTNTFTGSTAINTNMTLQGNSNSLKGNIADNGALIFDQTINGTYSGQLSGTGAFTKQGGGRLTLTGNSSGFGSSLVNVTGGALIVNGNLGGMDLTSAAGTTIGGTGTYSISSTATIQGILQPGDGGIGTLTFTGDVTLGVGAPELDIEISPTQADFLSVAHTFTQGGTLVIQPLSGFYGFSRVYPIANAGTALAGAFTSTTSSNPNFAVTTSVVGNTLYANVTILRPFLGFPAANGNIQSVIDNLDDLNAAGQIAPGSSLALALDALIGLSNADVNKALDQLHPALFSGFYDLQAQVGSQIITFFHRRPAPLCGCCEGDVHAWAEPYGNWLDQKNKGIELGFNAYSKGIAAGIDKYLSHGFSIGFGGAWHHTELRWHNERGHSDLDGFYGGMYLDYIGDYVYIGASALAGRDFFHTSRKITFSTVNDDADGKYRGLEFLGQLATAYFLGPDQCCLFPYFNLDFFYLKQNSFTEKNAPGLNLHVRKNRDVTMRSELGLGLQVIDRNRTETICVSPQLSMGWSYIHPIFREDYTANFDGYTIPFKVKGWDHTWNLFTTRFGLTMTYTCYSLSGEYLFEMDPQHGTPLFDQRCNIRFDFNW